MTLQKIIMPGGVAGEPPARGVAAYGRYVDVSAIAAQGGHVPPYKR